LSRKTEPDAPAVGDDAGAGDAARGAVESTASASCRLGPNGENAAPAQAAARDRPTAREEMKWDMVAEPYPRA